MPRAAMGVAQFLSASSSQIRGKSGRGDGCANASWQRINKARPQKTPDSFTCIITSELRLLHARVLLRGSRIRFRTVRPALPEKWIPVGSLGGTCPVTPLHGSFSENAVRNPLYEWGVTRSELW